MEAIQRASRMSMSHAALQSYPTIAYSLVVAFGLNDVYTMITIS